MDLYYLFKNLQPYLLWDLFLTYQYGLCISDTAINSACLTQSVPTSLLLHMMVFRVLCMNCPFLQIQPNILKPPCQYLLCFVFPALLLFTQCIKYCVLMWEVPCLYL